VERREKFNLNRVAAGFPFALLFRSRSQVPWPVFITFIARKGIIMSRYCLAVLGVAALLNAGGCVVWPSYNPGKVDLSNYNRLVIKSFDAGEKAPGYTAEKNKVLCANIQKHVMENKSQPFNEIDTDCKNCQKELVLTGTVLDYEPGNPGLRMMLIGLGPAHFKIEVCLKDGATGEILDKSIVSSLFVVGGMIGGSVQEPTFVNDLGRAISNGVCNAKKKG
jgi:hypothetical protein